MGAAVTDVRLLHHYSAKELVAPDTRVSHASGEHQGRQFDLLSGCNERMMIGLEEAADTDGKPEIFLTIEVLAQLHPCQD